METVLNQLLWIAESLSTEAVARKMHGGVGYYIRDKLVLILVEASLTYEHKGISYPFQIWNGCIVPVEKIKQTAVWLKLQFLENHPAHKNWLYLPMDSEDFEDQMKLILREIKKGNPLFGLPVKMKAPVQEADEIDGSQPKMFVHGPVKKIKENPSVKKKTTAKPKADKKRENGFFLSVLKGKK